MTLGCYESICHQSVCVYELVSLVSLIFEQDEYVVFVTPTSLQASMFSSILNPDRLDDLSRGSTADALALINLLTKISNSPVLLKATADKAKAKPGEGAAVLKRAGVQDALKMIPNGVEVGDMKLSGEDCARCSAAAIDPHEFGHRKTCRLDEAFGGYPRRMSISFVGDPLTQLRRTPKKNVSSSPIIRLHSPFWRNFAGRRITRTLDWMGKLLTSRAY